MKRQRGRNNNRRNNNNHNNNNVNPNRSMDSNGPDVKIRGSANTIYEKYINLARDAKTSGNRVKAESYLQHAEHYLRLHKEVQAKADAAKAEKEAARAAREEQQRQARAERGESDAHSGDNSGDTDKNNRRNPRSRRNRDDNQNNDKAADAPAESKSDTAADVEGLEVVKSEADVEVAAKPTRRKRAPARKKADAETIEAAE